jgi:hypothetical protein
VAPIVDSVLIQDQRVGQCADFQKSVPIGRVARQLRCFQAQNDSGAPRTHLANQFLETFSVGRGRSRLAQVAVDDDDRVLRIT